MRVTAASSLLTPSIVQSHAGPCWARSSSWCTQLTLSASSSARVWQRISTLTTCKYTAAVVWTTQHRSAVTLAAASNTWMGTNRLQLNTAKTEFLWSVPSCRHHQFSWYHLAVGPVQVASAASVRDLGVNLDSHMSVRSHVTRLVCTSLSILWQIAAFVDRCHVQFHRVWMSQSPVCHIVIWTDCSLSSTLPHVSQLARTVGITSHRYLRNLHRLRMPHCIQYKLCVLVYLQNVICPVASVEPRRRLRSASTAGLNVPLTRRSTMGDRAFTVAGSRARNSLNDAVRRSSSLAVFKRSLTTHFFTHRVFTHHVLETTLLWLSM